MKQHNRRPSLPVEARAFDRADKALAHARKGGTVRALAAEFGLPLTAAYRIARAAVVA